jgi:hypothetical protein
MLISARLPTRKPHLPWLPRITWKAIHHFHEAIILHASFLLPLLRLMQQSNHCDHQPGTSFLARANTE